MWIGLFCAFALWLENRYSVLLLDTFNFLISEVHMSQQTNIPVHDHAHDHHHDHSFKSELLHHLPYAIFSVALGMIILSLLDYSSTAQSIGQLARREACSGYHMLFHSFHFLHILFAATGTIITFSCLSNSFWQALVVGLFHRFFSVCYRMCCFPT